MSSRSKRVNILGVNYTVRYVGPENKIITRKGAVGYTNPRLRVILVLDTRQSDAYTYLVDHLASATETMRHEVIHAFLDQSGLGGNSMPTDAWACNEEMVDWFAIQWPKIQLVIDNLSVWLSAMHDPTSDLYFEVG